MPPAQRILKALVTLAGALALVVAAFPGAAAASHEAGQADHGELNEDNDANDGGTPKQRGG